MPTCDEMVQRWSDPKARPLFKGKLIDAEGCCCAQGDVLRVCGMSDDELHHLDQDKADRRVAKELGISVGHSVLLRRINDQADGCPQLVLSDPAKILGPHANLVLAFWRHIDTMTDAAWTAAWDAAWTAAWDAAWTAAWTAAWDAARTAARDAAGDAAWDAARDAAWDAAGLATWELQGWSKMTNPPYFLKFFFADPAAWVASVEAEGK